MSAFKQSIPFSSSNKNRYICAKEKRHLLLCHPVLHYFLHLFQGNIDIDNWLKNLPAQGIELEGLQGFSKQEIEYYYRKFLFLKEHGYFQGIPFDQRFSQEIKPERIEQDLANVKQVLFETTDACNLKCAYCGYGKYYLDYDPREGKRLDPAAAKQLLTYLQQYWNSGLNTSVDSPIGIGFYGGEPLLNFPFIQEIVDFVQGLQMPRQHFVFAMTTNALLLEKYMDFVSENQFELLISLDGNRRNNSYRLFPDGSQAYEHILHNVYALRQKYPDYFREKVNFAAVFHNRSSLQEIHDFFKTRFDKIPIISELNTYGIDPSHKQEFWNMYASQEESFQKIEQPEPLIRDMFLDLPGINSLSKFLHEFSHAYFKDYTRVMDIHAKPRRLLTGTCFPFSFKIFLTVNHKLLPCERIGQQYSLGQVTEHGVEIDPDKIARIYNSYLQKITRLCRKCYFADICGQCMFHLDLENEQPQCPNFTTYKELQDFFAALVHYLEENPWSWSRIIKEVMYE